MGLQLSTAPFTTQFQLITDDTGPVSGSGTWPMNFPPCTSTWFQGVVQDPSAISGLTLSNGLRATPP